MPLAENFVEALRRIKATKALKMVLKSIKHIFTALQRISINGRQKNMIYLKENIGH